MSENLPVSPRRKPTKGRKNSERPERDIAASHETVEEHEEGIYRVRRITARVQLSLIAVLDVTN